MDPVTAMLVVGGLSAAGGALGQRSANRTNLQSAREQMEFQERMSGSTAQRAVADFTAAGLNPALAYAQQAPAPSGAMATVGNVAEGLDRSVASALAARQQQQMLEEQLTNLKADTLKKRQDGALAEAQGGVAQRQQIAIDEQNNQRRAITNRIQQLTPAEVRKAVAAALIEESKVAGAQAQGRFDARLGEAKPAVGFITSNAKNAVGMLPTKRGRVTKIISERKR